MLRKVRWQSSSSSKCKLQMEQKIFYRSLLPGLMLVVLIGCRSFEQPGMIESKVMPASFGNPRDSSSTATMSWKAYFSDQNLVALIDSALKKNQELNISLQEIAILQNEVRARKGEYLPFVNLGVAAGVEKEGRYTRNG